MNQYFLTYLASLLFAGTNGIAASFMSLSSYEIVFLRCFMAFFVVLALFLITQKGRFTMFQHPRSLFFVVLSGASMGANWMFLYEAYDQIGVTLATLACYCGPVIVMALSPLLFHERLTLAKVGGFGVVFLGIILVNGQVFLAGNSGWGLFCAAMTMVTYACMIIFNKFGTKIGGLENSVVLFCVSSLVTGIVLVIQQGVHLSIQPTDILPLLYLGFLSTGVGNHLYFASMKHLPAQTISVCGYIEPLVAVILSAVILHEAMSVPQMIGAACILGGAIFCEMMPNKTAHSDQL